MIHPINCRSRVHDGPEFDQGRDLQPQVSGLPARRSLGAVFHWVVLLVLAWLAPPVVAQGGAPLLDVAQVVTSGLWRTCALTTAGGVKCWGDNAFGQLGDGTTTQRLMPVDVAGLGSGLTAVAAGYYHTCALTTAGGVKCWGLNNWGQLGDGTFTQRLTPVDVAGLSSGVIAIAAGSSHTCALTSAGGIKCWGRNSYGQLGDGTTTARLTPVDVSGLTSNVAAIDAGWGHTCALTTAGGAKCWGANLDGQLGDGSNGWKPNPTPVDVVGLSSGVAAITTAGDHTCALTTTGGAKCWGNNREGQLGDGTSTMRLTPVDVVGLGSGVAAIDAGGSHTCALTTIGGVKCWGGNYSGGIGDGTTADRLTPVDVIGMGNGILVIAAGLSGHTCAVAPAGGLKCWGSNEYGQLGDGTLPRRLTPVDVVGLTGGMAVIAAGDRHGCARTNVGAVRCWGANGSGQLGDGTRTTRPAPVSVVGLSGGVAAITTGGNHTCALTVAGGVKCWGDNGYGQLGDGTTVDRLTPVDVAGLGSGVAAIHAGDNHTCAVTIAGGAKCWGYNYWGQLGDDTGMDRLTPVDVAGLGSGVAVIALGGSHTCAVTTAGGAKCWGQNYYGQLGDGTQGYNVNPTPLDVVGLGSGVAAIVASSTHTCARTTADGVKCWGSNGSGQLGDGTTTARLTPVDVVGLGNGVAVISAGGGTTCALTTVDGVKCWGSNYYGGIGDGTTIDRLMPVDVVGLTSGASAISGGTRHTCAIVEGGAKCWGSHQHGQLGIGGRNYGLPGDVILPPPPVVLAITIEPLEILRGEPPELRSYRVTVANLGSETAQDVQATIPVPAGLTDMLWDCQAPGGCTPINGSGAVAVSFDLGAGESAQIELSGEVLPGVAFVEVVAQASTASGGGAASSGSTSDPANGIGLFKHGFER